MRLFDSFAISEQGRDLDGNEDCVIVDSDNGIFIVADGMGGRPGGAQASKIAVDTLRNELQQMEPIARMDEALLRNAVAKANAAVRAVSKANPVLEGMGTTLTGVIFVGKRGKIVHVGDSRVYRFAAGRIEQLTQDHTLVAELIARNHLSEEGAKRFPLRHVLSRSIGTKETVETDIDDFVLVSGEWILLATDGLYRVISVERLEEIMVAKEGRDAAVMCHAIMNAALKAHPQDNVTVAVIRLCEEMTNG